MAVRHLGAALVVLTVFCAPSTVGQERKVKSELRGEASALSEGDIPSITSRAEAGDAKAQFLLALAYSGWYQVPQNTQESLKWLRRAAEQGHPEAQHLLGECYRLGRGIANNYREAVKWYQLSADQGFAPAQADLAAMYDMGMGVRRDKTESLRLLRLAVAQNEPGASMDVVDAGGRARLGRGSEQRCHQLSHGPRCPHESSRGN